MVMNINGSKEIQYTNYNTKNNIKGVPYENDKNSDSIRNQGVYQDLETDTFVKSIENDTENSTYKPIKKKLSTEEVKALKDEQENIKTNLIKKFINSTINNQNNILGKSIETETENAGISEESKDLLTKIFGSVEKAYPPIGRTPEDAQKAISEGGAYSVSAVADRIITMAKAIAGDDEEKLQEMRVAAEKGFAQAELKFKNLTNSELPQISKDTITEVMNRFDKLQNKTDTDNN
jgi:hypothetical protein